MNNFDGIIHQNNWFIAELLPKSKIAGINFGKFKKLLQESYCFGSLFVMYSYFLYFLYFFSLKTIVFIAFVKIICTKSADNNYLFKVNNKSPWTRCELCSKLTTKTSGQRHCSRSDVFIFNFEHVCTYVSIARMFDLYVCFYCWFWTNICLLGGIWIFRDTIY